MQNFSLKNGLCRLLCISALSVTAISYETDAKKKTDNRDWSQWRGPNRDGISTEIGLLRNWLVNWPNKSPQILWKAAVGDGYSAIAVANGRLYTMWNQKGEEYLICLDAATGKEVWQHNLGSAYRDEQGNGPRVCPTADGDLVFAIAARAKLAAVTAKTGALVWSHNLPDENGGKIPRWGYSSSPLVEGERLFVEVGGRSDFAFAAFDKKTGKLLWASQTDRPAYSSPVAVTIRGTRQIVFFSASGLFAVTPANGKLLWKHPWQTDWDCNIATPIFIAPNKIFVSTNYGKGATAVQINGGQGAFEAETVWSNRSMKNHFNSCILHGKYLYGFDDSIFTCLDATTGAEKMRNYVSRVTI